MGQVISGDCLDELWWIEDESVDAIVTDPPYGIDFMGKDWDRFGKGAFQHWCELWATECLRVLRPGGHLLAFGGTKTWHRLTAGIEDAGFEIRDSIAWMYGSGFPKSMDVEKAIAKTGEDGASWHGWGTALKPAYEPIVVARKALSEKTVAANVLLHRAGGLNIDATRLGATGEALGGGSQTRGQQMQLGWHRPWMDDPEAVAANMARANVSVEKSESLGRWPSNVALGHTEFCEQVGVEQVTTNSHHPAERGAGGVSTTGHAGQADLLERDGTETIERWSCVAACPVFQLDQQAPSTGAAARASGPTLTGGSDKGVAYGARNGTERPAPFHSDLGGASRFMYVAKAPKSERPIVEGVAHPTVKPLALMRWLVRMVTPAGGLVLDPFAGSGATVEACIQEGFDYLAIEREAEYLPLIQARIDRSTRDAA